MTRRILLFHLLLTTFVVLGCLTSTTEMFEQRLVSSDQPGVIAGSGALTLAVDLRENSTWEEHHEDIGRVERIGFEAVAYSNNGAAAVFNIGFRTDPAAEFVQILTDLTPAPEPSELLLLLAGLGALQWMGRRRERQLRTSGEDVRS